MSNEIQTNDPEEIDFLAQAAAIKQAIGPAIPQGTSLTLLAFVATDLLCHCIVRASVREVQDAMLESARESLRLVEVDLNDPEKAATVAALPASTTLQ